MANVNFKRGDTATMNATAISDGLIFLNTEDNKIYFDNGSTRLQFGGDTSLISSVDDADVDNAFNASSTVNLFVQKNSIVDTKANALAVTQPQIPLGCLAFKEAVGTTNISTIGNGTLSGAISTINTNLGNKINTSAIANNLATTASGYVLDARQGKALNDKITTVTETTLNNGQKLVKYGKVVTVEGDTNYYWTDGMQIPEGYRPKNAIYHLLVIKDVSNVQSLAITSIGTNGIIEKASDYWCLAGGTSWVTA